MIPDGSPVGVFQGDAELGFTFTCDMELKKGKPRAVIRGARRPTTTIRFITLPDDLAPTPFPEVRLHGIVEPW